MKSFYKLSYNIAFVTQAMLIFRTYDLLKKMEITEYEWKFLKRVQYCVEMILIIPHNAYINDVYFSTV